LKISIKNATPNKGKTFQLVMLESPDSVHWSMGHFLCSQILNQFFSLVCFNFLCGFYVSSYPVWTQLSQIDSTQESPFLVFTWSRNPEVETRGAEPTKMETFTYSA
jgi:hypothetical protein